MKAEVLNLSDPERLQQLLNETECELTELQPSIEALEEKTAKLKELKLKKQRLITLKISLSTLLDGITKHDALETEHDYSHQIRHQQEAKLFNFSELSASKMFRPDEALKQVDQMLKQKGSLNYEMFKAVVYKGGKATTDEIRAFLVESGIQQPQSGETFENVPLTEISSRANYLVRKGILQPLERGQFYSVLGWVDSE